MEYMTIWIFLWDLINIESMAQNTTGNDVYLFEVLNCFIAHLNTHKVLLSLTNNGVINIDKRQIDFIRSSCRILSKCSDQIKKLKLEIFHKTQEDIYECLRTCIEEVDNTKANGSDDSEQFLDTVETISYMCDLIESNSKLELAMLLVQKLEQATMKKRKQIIFESISTEDFVAFDNRCGNQFIRIAKHYRDIKTVQTMHYCPLPRQWPQ